MSAELQTEWCFEVPDADHRRGVHIIAVTGEKYHSGQVWHRLCVGAAATMYEGRQGYVPEDIERLALRYDMDPVTATVVAWMDFITPPLTMDTRYLPALPTPERSRASQ